MEIPKIYARRTIPGSKNTALQLPRDLLEDLQLKSGDELYIAVWKKWIVLIPIDAVGEALERVLDNWAEAGKGRSRSRR